MRNVPITQQTLLIKSKFILMLFGALLLVVGSFVFSLRECKGRVDVDVFMCEKQPRKTGLNKGNPGSWIVKEVW